MSKQIKMDDGKGKRKGAAIAVSSNEAWLVVWRPYLASWTDGWLGSFIEDETLRKVLKLISRDQSTH